MSESEMKANRPCWKIEDSAPEKAAKLKEALRAVQDPELGYNVIELGLIRDARFDENITVITMILTTPFCPYAGVLVEEVRKTAAEALGTDAKVDLCFDPWDPNMLEEGIDLFF